MNFYCTIKFEELSLPTFFQGKKKTVWDNIMVRQVEEKMENDLAE